MGNLFFPIIGQILRIEISPDRIETRKLIALTETNCIVRDNSGIETTYSRDKIRGADFKLGALDDALFHLVNSGSARHCPYCYIGMLYAVDMLATNFGAQAFSSRSSLLKNGIISYLEGVHPIAGYSLLPQLEGIVHQVLHEDGLLKVTKGFPVWTREHPNDKLHKHPCKNIVQAINGAIEAREKSRLNFINISTTVDLENIRQIRNNLMHGTLLDITEHQVSSIIYMLHAAYEGVSPNLQ